MCSAAVDVIFCSGKTWCTFSLPFCNITNLLIYLFTVTVSLTKNSDLCFLNVLFPILGVGFFSNESLLKCNLDLVTDSYIFLFFFPQADSDAHSTTSSVSPAQSPSYSNQSDDGSDIESKQRRSTPSIFSFLDRSYWKRQVTALSFVDNVTGQVC